MSIKLKDTIYDLINNADKLDNKHASDFATSGHTHNLGNKNATDLSSTYPSGISIGGIYNNGYPFTYGSTITASGNGGYFQIAGQWNSGVNSSSDYDYPTEMYIRGRRDSYDVWTTWSRVLTDRNYTNFAAKKDHTHNYASTVTVGSTAYSCTSNNITIPAYPTALKCPTSLTIQFNGTSQGAWDGSAAKTINITPASIGAAASHSHPYLPTAGGTLTGNLALESDGSYRKISIGKSSEYYAVFHNSTYNGDGREASIAWYNGSAIQGAIGVKTFPFFVNSSGVVYTLYHTGNLNINNLNADTLDGYHESSFWRNDASNKIWNPSTNIKMTPTSSGQEWSFDFRDKGSNTGSYWQVWDESKTTLLKVDADSGIVSAPYGFSGSLSGNASTATALTSNAGSSTQPIYFSGGKPVACTYTLGKSVPSNAVFTDTNTWRGITDSYSGTASDTSLSQKGGNALYNALVNGYANSAGSAGALTNLTRASQAAWGTLTSANGYKDIGSWNESDGSGGSWSIQSKGGKIYMQIDGEYYANEGKYRLLHQENTYVSGGYGVIDGTTITKVSYSSSTGYIANGNAGNLNEPTTWSSEGARLVFDNYSGSASNKPVSVDNANSLVTFFKTKHGTSGQYASQLAFPDHNRFYFRYAAAGTWQGWNTVAFTSDIPTSLPANGGNADTVDGYHASSLWRSDGGTWNPSANISLSATANGQEWSFDITRNGKTGCYWHVWDSSLGSCLRVDADNGKVTACYSFNCATLQIGGETITFTT